MHDNDFHESELASWLQEAGRRRRAARAPEPAPVIGAPEETPAPAPSAPKRALLHHPRELFLAAVAALSYLPYFFADVHVQIASLPHVIVFV